MESRRQLNEPPAFLCFILEKVITMADYIDLRLDISSHLELEKASRTYPAFRSFLNQYEDEGESQANKDGSYSWSLTVPDTKENRQALECAKTILKDIHADGKPINTFLEEPAKTEYKYYMRNRPLSIGTVPKGFTRFDENDIGDKGGRYGAVFYDHPLSEKEVKEYGLIPNKTPNTVREFASHHFEVSCPAYSVKKGVTFDDLDACLKHHGNPCSLLTGDPFYMDSFLQEKIIKEYARQEGISQESVKKVWGKNVDAERHLPRTTTIHDWVKRNFGEKAGSSVHPTATFDDFYQSIQYGNVEHPYHHYLTSHENQHPNQKLAQKVLIELACMTESDPSYRLAQFDYIKDKLMDTIDDVKEFYLFERPYDDVADQSLRYGTTFDELKACIEHHESPQALLSQEYPVCPLEDISQPIQKELSVRYNLPLDPIKNDWYANARQETTSYTPIKGTFDYAHFPRIQFKWLQSDLQLAHRHPDLTSEFDGKNYGTVLFNDTFGDVTLIQDDDTNTLYMNTTIQIPNAISDEDYRNHANLLPYPSFSIKLPEDKLQHMTYCTFKKEFESAYKETLKQEYIQHPFSTAASKAATHDTGAAKKAFHTEDKQQGR